MAIPLLNCTNNLNNNIDIWQSGNWEQGGNGACLSRPTSLQGQENCVNSPLESQKTTQKYEVYETK